jgi:hypothetical protein
LGVPTSTRAKRLEETIAVADEQGRARLTRIASVLEALTRAARTGDDIATAVTAIADLDVIAADAALIRRTIKPGRPDVLGELASEYRVFKQVGARFLATFIFDGRSATGPLRTAMGILIDLGGDWRKGLPEELPMGHVELRWHRHVVQGGKIDRTYWELATFFAVSSALASGNLWVATSRIHRSLEDLLTPPHTGCGQRADVAAAGAKAQRQRMARAEIRGARCRTSRDRTRIVGQGSVAVHRR